MATFDGPGRAIRCAQHIVESVEKLGVRARAGIHTGECETVGNDIAGLAVHIAARVSAIAEPGQILVSSTVKDLVSGSGIQFKDMGARSLKGIDAPWRLFAAEA